MSYEWKKIGKKLQKHRKMKGITQSGLANKLGYISPQFISNYERGLCAPSLDSLPRLAGVLDIDPEDIIELLLEFEEQKLRELFAFK